MQYFFRNCVGNIASLESKTFLILISFNSHLPLQRAHQKKKDNRNTKKSLAAMTTVELLNFVLFYSLYIDVKYSDFCQTINFKITTKIIPVHVHCIFIVAVYKKNNTDEPYEYLLFYFTSVTLTTGINSHKNWLRLVNTLR